MGRLSAVPPTLGSCCSSLWCPPHRPNLYSILVLCQSVFAKPARAPVGSAKSRGGGSLSGVWEAETLRSTRAQKAQGPGKAEPAGSAAPLPVGGLNSSHPVSPPGLRASGCNDGDPEGTLRHHTGSGHTSPPRVCTCVHAPSFLWLCRCVFVFVSPSVCSGESMWKYKAGIGDCRDMQTGSGSTEAPRAGTAPVTSVSLAQDSSIRCIGE